MTNQLPFSYDGSGEQLLLPALKSKEEEVQEATASQERVACCSSGSWLDWLWQECGKRGDACLMTPLASLANLELLLPG